MLDAYHVITLTHREAHLSEIAQVALREEDNAAQNAALNSLKQQFGWEELMYLSTCNRVMYFFYAPNKPSDNIAQDLLETIRLDLTAAQIQALASKMSVLNGADAIRHIFEVASSMDSLVVGEREILRQLREAFEQSKTWGLTGDHIRLLMRFTVETAKEIYTHTGIGEKSVSVVSLAFGEMMKTNLSKNARVLLVGAGQTNALFSKFLLKQGFSRVTVFNRSIEKAQDIAQSLGGKALLLSELEYFSEGFDAIVVCTGSLKPIITKEIYQNLLAGETNRKVIVDLSVPNNTEQEVVQEFPIRYIEIEGLRGIAQQNLAHRERERVKADEIITQKLYHFRSVWHERQVERSMQHIPAEVRAVTDKAVNEVFRKEFEMLDPEAKDLVLRMLGYVEKKCIAIPIKAAKSIVLNQMREASHKTAKPQ